MALGYVLLASCVVSVLAKEESQGDLTMSITLLGSVCFMMGLFYLTNWPDKDIRGYTYNILSATISIFCAVLVFQAFNDLITPEHIEVNALLFRNIVHMLFWYTFLQLFLAYCSGAVKKPRISLIWYVTQATAGPDYKEKRANMTCLQDGIERNILNAHQAHEIHKKVEANMKCFAVLLAHMTGFASINAWGFLQQKYLNEHGPLTSLLVCPIALVFQMGLMFGTDQIRTYISKSDDNMVDKFEENWDEECEDAENDIMGLTLSFLMVQSLRYWFNGKMPDIEGHYKPSGPEALSSEQLKEFHVWYLLVAALCFCGSMFILRVLRPDRWEKEAGEEQDEEEEEEEEEGGEKEEEEETVGEKLKKRYYDAAITVLGMSFAWGWFYGFRAAMAKILPHVNLRGEEMALAVALVIAITSFTAIFILDKLADAEFTGPKVDEAIIQIITSMGILVGFAWEQCFDESVEALAESLPDKHLAKLFLAIGCSLVVVPAWRLYMLPMVIHEGWAHGFIINSVSIKAVFEHIKLNKNKGARVHVERHIQKHEKHEELKGRRPSVCPVGYVPIPDAYVAIPDADKGLTTEEAIAFYKGQQEFLVDKIRTLEGRLEDRS